MASRRKLKKSIKQSSNLLIEDAFIESLNGDAKMDGLIDKIIEQRFESLNKVCAYPNRGSRAEVKAHFEGLKSEFDKGITEYTKKVGKVS